MSGLVVVQRDRAIERGWGGRWESINGADSWENNPWVWVVSFKRIS